MKRVTIDMSESMKAEIDRVASIGNLSIAQIMRLSVKLLILYIEARACGKQFVIVDPKRPDETVKLEVIL